MEDQRAIDENRWLANLSREVAHAVIVQDLEGRVLSWNEGASMLFGYNRDDTYEMPVEDLVPEEFRGDYSKRLKQVIQYGYTEPHECTRVTLEREFIDVFVEMTLLRDPQGNAEAVATVERDITDQRIQEAKIEEMHSDAKVMLQKLKDKEGELERKECLINGILGSAADGILTMGPEGLLESCNDAANRMFGYEQSETENMTIATLLPGEEERGVGLGALERVVTNYPRMSKRMREAVDSTGLRKNGKDFPVTFSVSELHVGDRLLYTVILRDETQRKIVENQLNVALERAQAAVQAKSQFLATMSHEIRTPMNAVISIGELLEETPLDDEQLDFVQTIRGSSQSLLMIINDILDFSKIESGKLDLEEVPVSLRGLVEIVGQMLAPVAFAKGLEIVLETDPSCEIEILSDPTRLKQILINLTGNAIKFTSKGEVRIRAHITNRQGANARVVLEVCDTGIGIPPSAHAKIFESFSQADNSTTREFGGTGLGLAISRQLALAFGGEMGLDSEVGVGSRFWVEFPAAVQDPEAPLKKIHFGGRSVLLLEPNNVQRKRTEIEFESLGAVVYSAADSASALEHIMQGRGIDWALAVVDCKPSDADALQFVRGLGEHPNWQGHPVLVLTEPSTDTLTLDFSEGTGLFSLLKPMRQSPLASVLRLAISKPGEKPKAQTKAQPIAQVQQPEPAAPLPSESAEEPALKSSPANASEPVLNKNGVQQFGYHILLVEDNPINRKVAGKLLQRMGCTWDEAVNGQLGVEAAFSDTEYDLILMDLMMPVMGGIEATRKIREMEAEGPGPPRTIIAMTANAMADDRRMCLDAGMDEYVSKPVKPKILEAAMLEWGAVHQAAKRSG